MVGLFQDYTAMENEPPQAHSQLGALATGCSFSLWGQSAGQDKADWAKIKVGTLLSAHRRLFLLWSWNVPSWLARHGSKGKPGTFLYSSLCFLQPCLPTTSPNPENTLKLTPIPMAYLGGQKGMNCPELEGLLLEERTVRCRVCGELGLQSATRMTQKLNIVSDINRASHRANTGPPSPSTDSHEH